MSEPQSRALVWVPIVHTEADLGSMTDAVRRRIDRSDGPAGWDERQRAITAMWEALRAAVAGLGLDPRTVRLYQDGLPVCDREAQIVRDLAQAGSPNHVILRDWMDRGATLTGTESPALVLEEYEVAQQLLRDEAADPALVAHSRDVLARRDVFIAGRIAATLRPGETGLLFLGLLHSLEGMLPADIIVTRLRYLAPLPSPQLG